MFDVLYTSCFIQVPQPTRPLVVCDRGRKIKPKIILAIFSPGLNLGSIRPISNENFDLNFAIHEKEKRIDGGGIDTNAARES